MSNILTSTSKANQARETASKLSSGNVFVGIGQHVIDGTDAFAATATDTESEFQQVFSNLIAGARVGENDVNVLINRNTWTINEVYPQYSSGMKTDCFVTVEQGSSLFVYKCLNNNKGAQSAQVPFGTNTDPFQTTDGYVWQYMFTIPQETFERFATSSLIPLVEDPAVKQNTVGGTIDAITIADPGVGYTNTIEGSFRVEDIVTGNTLTYKLGLEASPIDNFYNGCMIEITTPSSPAFGEMIEIVDYNGATKTATLEKAFSLVPEIGDLFVVSPGVTFTTNSSPDIEAVVRAVIDNQQVVGFVIAERGKGYRTTSVAVNADPSVAATPASIEASVSPSRGHGFDIAAESPRRAVAVQKTIDLTQAGVEETNDFRAISLIDTPLFSRTAITLESNNPERFATNEQVIQYSVRGDLAGNTTFQSPSSLTGACSNLKAGDTVMINNGQQNLLVEIDSVIDDSTAVATSNFTGTFEGSASIVTKQAEATVTGRSGSALTITDVTPSWSNEGNIYGISSRSTDKTTTFTISGRNTLNVFKQTSTLSGTFVDTVFQQDEQIIGTDGSTAFVHSISAEQEVVSVTSGIGQLSAQQYVGQTTGAVFNVSAVEQANLVVDSGEILFVNNIAPISITNNKKISTKIVIEF